MSEDIDPNGPWWKGARMPPLDSYFNVSWASLGLTNMAILGGAPALEMNGSFSLKEDDTFDTFLAKFSAAFPGLRNIGIDTGTAKIAYYVADHGAVSVKFDGDINADFHVVSRDPKFLEEFKAFKNENTTMSIPKGRVHVLVSTQKGPEFKSMGIGGLALERGNYEDVVLKGFDRIVADLSSAAPAGRIAILDGKPGSGKTFLVRGLLDAVKDVVFVIVPANLVTQLAQPGMIPALVSLHQSRGGKPMVFLIEDADECLAPRMGDNMSAVSVMLNLGDGILGQLLDVRIVATTNAHHQEIDEAIKRPGRLSAMLHVGYLSAEKAGEVYERLTGKPARVYPDMTNPLDSKPLFNSKTSLAEVYQMARDTGWTPPPPERKMGFGANDDDFEGDDDYFPDVLRP